MCCSYIKRLAVIIAMMISLMSVCLPVIAKTQQVAPASIQEKLAELEASSGGRIGIAAINTASNKKILYRADELFPFVSTFKVIVVSAILKKSMTNHHLLQQKVIYTKHDLVFWSPITEKHVADGMTISDLCAASIMYSDNTAANILVKQIGGPEAVTAFARSIGNHTFRLDNWEPELNSNPKDKQDTSTPSSMENSLQQLTLGSALAPEQREQLVRWMKGNILGGARIRAGVPKDWVVADKTGSSSYGVTNDIGIIWPPKSSPIVVAIYYVQSKKNATLREDVVASATHLLVNEFVVNRDRAQE